MGGEARGHGPDDAGRALDELAEVCAHTRRGDAADAVDGVRPAYVAAPGTVGEASAVLRIAAGRGLRVVARGNGTKIGWGRPPAACDLVVETTRLDRVIDHAAGDLVVRVEAGVPVATLSESLATSGQRLALDSPLPGATVGGTLATATAGPRRLLYGTARDLLIGVTIVRADGVVASAGGRVVKNVAGYDLGKLLTGSYGTLGLMVNATFRLHPLPAAAAYVTTSVPDSRTAVSVVGRVLHSPYVPTAVEIDRPGPGDPITVVALVEGVPAGTEARAAGLRELMRAPVDEPVTTPEIGDRPPPWWGRYPDGHACDAAGSGAAAEGGTGDGRAGDGAGPGSDGADGERAGADDAATGGERGGGAGGGVLIQVRVPPMDVATVLDVAAAAELPRGVRVRGSAGTGVVHVALPAGTTAEDTAGFLARLRQRLPRPAGSAVVLRAPRRIRETVDLWGPVPALPLMRRVKDEFDPGHLLAPGRFVGGI